MRITIDITPEELLLVLHGWKAPQTQAQPPISSVEATEKDYIEQVLDSLELEHLPEPDTSDAPDTTPAPLNRDYSRFVLTRKCVMECLDKAQRLVTLNEIANYVLPITGTTRKYLISKLWDFANQGAIGKKRLTKNAGKGSLCAYYPLSLEHKYGDKGEV